MKIEIEISQNTTQLYHLPMAIWPLAIGHCTDCRLLITVSPKQTEEVPATQAEK